MSEQREALAEVLAAHEADVTSYDAGDIHGCDCGWTLPLDLASRWDAKWPAYRAHQADALLDSSALARLLADAEQRGAGRVAAAVEAVAFKSRRVGTATANPWVEGWNQALEVCQHDLRAALAPGAADRVRAEEER